MNRQWRVLRPADRDWIGGTSTSAVRHEGAKPGARLARVLADDRIRERAEIILVVLIFILALLVVGQVNGQPLDAVHPSGASAASPAPGAARVVGLSDEAVKVYVDGELIGDEGVNAYQVVVAVSGGVATLEGVVDTPLAKTKAVAAAQRAHGVVRVEDRLRVRSRAVGVDDGVLGHAVKSALAGASRSWAGRPAAASVSSNGGRIVLTGCSDSYAQKMMTGELVQAIPGVVSVDNLLGVQPFVNRTDGELAAEIQGGLEQAGILVGDAVVSVKDGYAALEGSVPTGEEKRLAERAAWIPGVLGVNVDRLDSIEPELAGGGIQEDALTMVDILKRDRILAAWRADPRVGPGNIYVRVNGDVATLTGRADTLETKLAAEDLALMSAGIRDVVNEMTIRPASLPSAACMRAELVRDIRLSPTLDPRRIDVRIAGGTAILDGRVPTARDRRYAGELAARRPGVTRVVNNIRVGRWRLREDKEIQNAVEENLFWGPGVSRGRVMIQANTRNGAVTLTGCVVAPEVARAAIDRAYESGAQTVINQMRVADAAAPGN